MALGRVTLDLFHRDATDGQRWAGLHPREFAVLWHLAEQPRLAHSRACLLRAVWRLDHNPETNRVEVAIARARAKLARLGATGLIETDPAGGYRLARQQLERPWPAQTLDLEDVSSYVLRDTAAPDSKRQVMTGMASENDRVSVMLSEDGVAQVRLTRGDKMNALDRAMFAAIIEAGHQLHETKGLRAVVLSGEGRSFCAGLDVASFQTAGGEGEPPLTERTYGNANMFQQVAMQWRKLPVPVIAAIHGVCFGGGMQIASGADIRIAAPDARMAIMEMKWGLVPDMGGYPLWRGLVRDDVLRELVYTNREFSGEEGQQLGLVTHIDADPLERATAIAREIASRNPHAIRAAKRLSNAMTAKDTDALLMEESIEQHAIIRSPNQIEAVMAGMAKRAPNFEDVEP